MRDYGDRDLGKFGYTGQAWLPEVSLWYYKARDYDPELGRFLQTDPIGVAGGINLSAYVTNDPVNWTDPLGLGEDIVVCYGVIFNGVCHSEAWLERMLRPTLAPQATPSGQNPRVGPAGSSGSNPTRTPPLLTPCQRVSQEAGAVRADSAEIKLVLLAGPSYQTGTFTNISTGSSGKFTSWGAGLGLDLGYSGSETYYTSVASFLGYSETVGAGAGIRGIGTVAVSKSLSVSGEVTGLGAGYAPPTPLGLGRVGVSVTAGETYIYDCKVGNAK